MISIDIPGIITTDATPLQVLVKNLPVNSGVTAELIVQGIELATFDQAVFKAIHAGRRSTGNILVTGVQTPIHVQKTVGAATWTAAFSMMNGGIAVTLTGQIGKTITWNIGGSITIQPALAA
jgi:hypothetical protein